MATHVETMLANIEAVLEGRITSDVESYTIAGRQITKIPITELLTMRDKYRAERNGELAAESIAEGTGNPNKIRVRLL